MRNELMTCPTRLPQFKLTSAVAQGDKSFVQQQQQQGREQSLIRDTKINMIIV
jgi:hypothetical protein